MGNRKPPVKAPAKVVNPGKPPISNKLAETRIVQFMTRNPYYATTSTTVRLAIKTMLAHGISGLPVIDDSQTCVGMYSELDAMIQAAGAPLDKPIRFKKPVVSVPPSATFKEVLLLLAQKKMRRVPVLDDRKKLMGIVARRDLLKAFLADSEKED